MQTESSTSEFGAPTFLQETEWREDRYIQADHAWGGGIDLKYFFTRYFGVGFEGWVVSARQHV